MKLLILLSCFSEVSDVCSGASLRNFHVRRKRRYCCWANRVIWRRKTYMSSFNSRSTWRRTCRLSTNYCTIDCGAGKISSKETIDSLKKGKLCWRITLESIQERGRMELSIGLLLLFAVNEKKMWIPHTKYDKSLCSSFTTLDRMAFELIWHATETLKCGRKNIFQLFAISLSPKMGWSWSVYEYFSFHGDSNSHVHVSIREVGRSIVTFSGCWNELIVDSKLNAATGICSTTARKWIRSETKW